MNDPVDRLLAERERTADVGFRGGLAASFGVHLFLVGGLLAAPLLFPPGPPLKVASGFAVAMPRGGGGEPNAGAPPAAPEVPKVEPPAPEPPPKVLKPPKEEPRKGLPELDARKKPKKPQTPAPSTAGRAPGAAGKAGARGGTPGVAIGPPGPGVPEGTDIGGDWYLAGVTQKIWVIWNQQIKTGFNRQIGVTFTILADGAVADVQVTEPSGAALLDLAAQRAVLTAAPFAPLPKEYGTNRYTIRAIFRPAQ
jgi:protein TonB